MRETPIKELKHHLLRFGGQRFQIDDYIQETISPEVAIELLKYGKHSAGTNAILVEGEPSRCHENSINYWDENQHCFVCFGMALSDDGCWRVHWWAYDPKDERIIETTCPRTMYFGCPIHRLESIIKEIKRPFDASLMV